MISRRTIVGHMFGIVMLALIDPAHAGNGGIGGGGNGDGGKGGNGNGNGRGGSGKGKGNGSSGKGGSGKSNGSSGKGGSGKSNGSSGKGGSGKGGSGKGNRGTRSGKGVGPAAAGKAKGEARAVTQSVKPSTDLRNVPAKVQSQTATYRVQHKNGFQETLARGRYVMQDNRGRTIVNRVAQPRDYARLRELSRL